MKFREDFRPFAPAVTEESAATYFDGDGASRYMLQVAPARPAWREQMPNVVHCDGSCRIQTVTTESDPLFYALLRAFERRTGIPILLNTSFNRRGMPIVETPIDAIDFFLACELDVLVLDDYVVRKKADAAGPKPTSGEHDEMGSSVAVLYAMRKPRRLPPLGHGHLRCVGLDISTFSPARALARQPAS